MATISLCMIVKNEEPVLARCLDSAAGIADEIILVDTGSEDKTREVAARYTDKVFSFLWRDDFAAARNFSFSKASMDYCMWLDADDVIAPEEREKIITLKKTLTPEISAVMMKYVTAFDDQGNPAFLFDRERLVRRDCGFHWEGRVHEVIDVARPGHGEKGAACSENPFSAAKKNGEKSGTSRILYTDIRIEHHSIKTAYPDRNLRIYETMVREGEVLSPREQFYYGRELYYHGRDEEAVRVLTEFLEHPAGGWLENKVDACRLRAACHLRSGREREALSSLLETFHWEVPRPPVCCELGSIHLKAGRLQEAEYWYRQAAETPYTPAPGAFDEPRCRGYLPAIQLAVCLDRQGRREEASRWNEIAAKYEPDSEAVRHNREYFKRFRSPL